MAAPISKTASPLAVIDEQHKFGVGQREALVSQGESVSVLAMTATPIPRTLTLSFYGDLDVSILDELPAGRGKLITGSGSPRRRTRPRPS
jgi:ATP-dependent DNA helicase RecG